MSNVAEFDYGRGRVFPTNQGTLAVAALSADARDYGATGDGRTNDTKAIQDAIDALYNNGLTGGVLNLVAGNYYCRDGLVVKGGVRLVGSGRNSCTISSLDTDVITLDFDSTCSHASAENLSIHGYQNQSASKPTIRIADNVPVFLEKNNIFFGYAAIQTGGVDGTVRDCYIAGYSYGVLSTGANRYFGNKMDNGGFPLGCVASFAQGFSFVGPDAPSENHFVMCDFTGNFQSAIEMSAGMGGTVITCSAGCVFGQPVLIRSGNFFSIMGCEVGDVINQGSGYVKIVGSVGQNAHGIGGNIEIVACTGIT